MDAVKNLKKELARKPAFFIPLGLAALVMLILLIHFGVNTPFWDQWEMVPLLQKVDHHTLSIFDFWQQHNEHRVFFPTIILMVNAYITHWHTGAEILIGYIFAVISGSLLFLMLRQTVKSTWLGLAAGFLIAFWFFSPSQWENWLWGWQVGWFVCMTAVISSIYFLTRFSVAKNVTNKRIIFGLAILSAIIASYSLAGGLLVWPVGLVLLILSKPRHKKASLAWLIIGIAAIGLYYYHYTAQPTPAGSPTAFLVHHPFGFVEFFFAFMGGIVTPLGRYFYSAIIFGMLLTAALIPLLYLVWKRRTEINQFLPWLSLILFALLGALITSYGRLGYGLGFALSSRYTSFSSLYVIGITTLSFILLSNDNKAKLANSYFVTTLIVLFSIPLMISSYYVGIRSMKDHSTAMKVIKACTHEINPTDNCLSLTYPSPTIVRPRLQYVKQKHLAGY